MNVCSLEYDKFQIPTRSARAAGSLTLCLNCFRERGFQSRNFSFGQGCFDSRESSHCFQALLFAH